MMKKVMLMVVVEVPPIMSLQGPSPLRMYLVSDMRIGLEPLWKIYERNGN